MKLGYSLCVSIIAGFFLALTLPRPGLCLLAWFAVAPLLYLLCSADSYKRAAFLAWIFGMGFLGTALYWIFSTCRFAGVPILVSALAWFALSAVLSFQWAIFGLSARWAAQKLHWAIWPWAWACFWTALEFTLDHSQIGMMKLEYTQWKYLSWIQGSSWAGPHALGFLILLVNGTFALMGALSTWIVGGPTFYLQGWKEFRRKLVSQEQWGYFTVNAIVVACLVMAWWGYGAWVLAGRKTPAHNLSIAILQPNIDQYQKWDEHYAQNIRADIDELMKPFAPSEPTASASAQVPSAEPKLILWPESSVPGWLDEPDNFRWVMALARKTGADNLIGVVTRQEGKDHNSAVLINPQGHITGYYHKRHLVAFGEFVPLRPLFSPWVGILDQMGDFSPGPARQPLLNSSIGNIGVTICFEAVFPQWTRTDASAGARWIANLTNDGWYKDTWGPYLHFYTNRFRAIENRITILRAANTGISGVIDPYGEVTARLGLNTRGVLRADIPADDPFPNRSLYSHWGDWFGWLNLSVAALLLMLYSPLSRL